MRVFSGNGSQALAQGICSHLQVSQGEARVDRFSNGEVRVQIGENIRGCDVYLVNSVARPVNDHLVELLILIDAANRASAARVTAVLPHFGYSRQDRKDRPRVPITAKLVSNLLVASGADRILTVDLHCGQIQGFFDIPLDHLSADVVFANDLVSSGVDDLVVVSPDTGSVARTREFAGRLDAPLVIVDKRRPKAGMSEVMNVIGDVEDRRALIFDDMIDSGGTLVNAAQALKDQGAVDVSACATHALFSGRCVDLIEESVLTEVVVSDSIPLSEKAAACPKVRVLSIAPLIGEAIRRIHHEESVSSLFV
jgi:ribose-phosphate pyrophosphokinase